MTSKIKVDNINKVSDDSNIINKCGTTITLGASGDSIALASGASQTGFGRTGTVDWQTGDIKTATFTAVNGEGYFANTSGGAFTMNLPAGTAGNIVSVVDYTNTFQTNNLTIAANGSQKIGGVAATIALSTEGQSITFVYVDDTEGWKNVQDSTSNVTGNPNLVATGGTITICGDCKIHTFTSPGTFTVSKISCTAPDNDVDYLVLAGGAGGGAYGGGGGAGGQRTSFPGGTKITVTATTFPITVGGGGAARVNGSVSTFSSITSAGGGVGGNYYDNPNKGGNGGAGGGGASSAEYPGTFQGGTGNTPPVSPPQGFNGGAGFYRSSPFARMNGGGGGSSQNGGCASSPASTSGAGGAGIANSITGSSVTRGGGGGGMIQGSGTYGVGGSGGGGDGSRNCAPNNYPGTPGTINTGGGGGASNPGLAGGSGIVIIRYKFQ
jgi:hypothetical protein